MAHSVEEDIYQLEAGLRNLNVEIKKEESNGMTSLVSPKNIIGNNTNVSEQKPNLHKELPEAAINSLVMDPNTSQRWNTVECDKFMAENKNEPKSRYVEENSASVTELTCSQQARNEDCSSVNELAGYFDNLLYIPKKMSPMAEMMYM